MAKAQIGFRTDSKQIKIFPIVSNHQIDDIREYTFSESDPELIYKGNLVRKFLAVLENQGFKRTDFKPTFDKIMEALNEGQTVYLQYLRPDGSKNEFPITHLEYSVEMDMLHTDFSELLYINRVKGENTYGD